MSLPKLLQSFDLWAADHPQNEDGWESDFSAYETLLYAALLAMLEPNASAQTVADIARVWSISEEREDLSDEVRRDPDPYIAIIPRIRDVGDWRARFQLYALASHVTALGINFAIQGLDDEDTYVVGRSLLAINEIDHQQAVLLAHRFLAHDDEYPRRIATYVTST